METISTDLTKLFFSLFNSENEDEVEKVIETNAQVFQQTNWYPLGGDESLFGVIENQQASPIPALIEKITNSIDAILTRKCYEAGIEPTSSSAPKSMEEAIKTFLPNSKQWDLPSFRKIQSESIQIIADGPRMDTSLIIYDDGEGQHPEDFEKTFLSLLRGNKNKTHFVQGKYNMGGSGALVFCGRKRYQLIASKRYDGTGHLGFTIIRQRKIGAAADPKRFSYFEYFKN